MLKLDLRQELKKYYTPSAKKIEMVQLPGFKFLMISGAIEANASPGTSPGFQQAMQALYGTAYTLKFMLKKHPEPLDYPVMPLEGLWWVEDGSFDIQHPGNWKYTMMILQPEQITEEFFNQAVNQVNQKKPNPLLTSLRLERFEEGLCIQTMHIGPYANEPATVARMQDFAQQQGFQMQGSHHEIYLGNPLRADPAKLKTILRHPVQRLIEPEIE